MRLIARKPCSFCGKDYFIGDEIPVDSVIDPIAQEKMGTLTIANLNPENPDLIYTQNDLDQKIEEAKSELESQVASLTEQVTQKDAKIKESEGKVETLTEQVTQKGAKIKELEQTVKDLQSQIAAAASISAQAAASAIEKPTESTASTKKASSKAGES